MKVAGLPSVTVVLPVYNGSRYLREAIDSVLTQTCGDFELLIRDDGSKDDTRQILASYADTRIRILPTERNLGIFGNLNLLLSEAKTDLVKIFCQDDRMLPGCLETQQCFMTGHPELAFCRVLECAATGEVARSQASDLDILPAIIQPESAAAAFFIFGNIPGNLSNVMLRRSVWLEMGKFRQDLPYAGDFEFWFRVACRHPFGLVKQPLNFVRDHGAQASKTLNRGNELARQIDRVFDDIYDRLPLTFRHSSITRLYGTVNSYTQAIHCGVLLALRGRPSGLAPLMAPARHRYGFLAGFAVYVFSLNRRIGMARIKGRMLELWRRESDRPTAS